MVFQGWTIHDSEPSGGGFGNIHQKRKYLKQARGWFWLKLECQVGLCKNIGTTQAHSSEVPATAHMGMLQKESRCNISFF